MASRNQPAPRIPGPGRPKLTNVKAAPPPKTAVPPKPLGQPKKKGGMKLVAIVILVLAVAGGGFFAYRHWHSGARKAAPAPTAGPQATYKLQTITVNLADTQASHFLRIGVVLQYPQDNAALAAELKDREYVIDDRVISDLRAKTYDDLATDRGEEALKQEIMHTVNDTLQKGKVTAVFFDDFLIQ